MTFGAGRNVDGKELDRHNVGTDALQLALSSKSSELQRFSAQHRLVLSLLGRRVCTCVGVIIAAGPRLTRCVLDIFLFWSYFPYSAIQPHLTKHTTRLLID